MSIKHPVTGQKVSPRKIAKYMFRDSLEQILDLQTWRERYPEVARPMTVIAQDKVRNQMKKLFRSMDHRHRLYEDGRNGEKRTIKNRARWEKIPS
jgi:hypothetical protein